MHIFLSIVGPPSMTHFSQAHTCVWLKGQLGSSILRAFLKSRLNLHAMPLLDVPSVSSSFCSTPPLTWTLTLATLTEIRVLQSATPPFGGQSGHLADSIQATGYEAKFCHRLWAHAFHLPYKKRELQPWEWLEYRGLWGFWPSSSTISSKQQPTFGSKHCTCVVGFGFIIQHWETSVRERSGCKFFLWHWETGARQRICCKCWRACIKEKRGWRFNKVFKLSRTDSISMITWNEKLN